LVFHLGYEILIVVLGFLVPKLLISVYGSEVNGLMSTITQMVKLVTLIQAGIATAATYSLYKPINDYNKVEIAKILLSAGKVFKKIGFSVLVLGLVVSLVLAISIKSGLSAFSIYIACTLFFIKTTIDLINTHVIRVFLTATQNNYLLSISYTIEHILYYGLTIVISLLHLNFIFIYISLLIGCFIKLLYLKYVFNKLYKTYYIALPKNTTLPKIKGMRYATYNEVAHSVVIAAIPIIITINCGLIKTSIYSIYLMIFNLLVILSTSVYSSFGSSFGSITAAGDVERINKVFEIFQYSFFTLTTWMYMCASILMIPFIGIYTKNFTDDNYVNKFLMVLMTLFGCFYSFRIPYNLTVSVNGLFNDTYLQPILTAVVTIVLSLIITPYNFVYALIGPIIFYAINTFYQHFKITKLKKTLKLYRFWNHFAVSVFCVGGAILYAVFIGITVDGYFQWMVVAICVAIICAIIVVAISLLLDRKSFILSIMYFKNKIKH